MKVLYVAAECKPFSKAGGVGDVAGELPVELRRQGVDIEIATPMYDFITAGEPAPPACWVKNGAAFEQVEWFRGDLHGVPVHFARNRLFGGKVYVDSKIPFYDDALRFSLFSEACLELIARRQPDVVHVNDWSLAYLLGRMSLERLPQARVLTIHNVAYQGNFGIANVPRPSIMADLLDGHGPLFHDPHEDWHSVNGLRLGIEMAAMVNAVSPTYAAEMTQPEDQTRYFGGGRGLEGVASRLRDAGRLTGILNGFEYQVPASGVQFERMLEQKKAAKTALAGGFANPGGVLLGFVGRAVEQKFKLLTETLEGKPVLEHILDIPGANVAILATGLPEYHTFLDSYRGRDNYSATLRFDADLARQICLGCDVFLMPSLFEPCGITQMESMSNATPPLVRKTGGLADTVTPHNASGGCGFVFDGATGPELLRNLVGAVRNAVEMFGSSSAMFRQIQRNAFGKRFLWKDSARRYIKEVYKPATKKKRGRPEDLPQSTLLQGNL
jgi:starch synthase